MILLTRVKPRKRIGPPTSVERSTGKTIYRCDSEGNDLELHFPAQGEATKT
jgi:hypothetical protein